MKIALPTKDGMVDNHFGHCENFTICSISDGRISTVETLPVQQGCGCKSGLATILHDRGVEVILAGNMGEGARCKFAEEGIQVIRGCTGKVEVVINDYMAGTVKDSGSTCSGNHECDHHGHRHDCNRD